MRGASSLPLGVTVESRPLIAAFADVLGVDPALQAKRNSADRDDEEWEKLFGEDAGDDEYGIARFGSTDKRAAGLQVSKR